jgi:thioester reductase-like protein
MAANPKYLLLTGATGLLGRSLVRDLSATGRRVAVLVRGSKTASAEARGDEILDDWREVAGVTVEAPVVLAGDITSPGLGLDAARAAWVERNVDEVVHSAASLSFQMRESDGEPWNSNVNGTAHVLDLCRDLGIRRYHHVSSAYVCGTRRGRILESELDVGQTPGNDYERSKIESENAAVSAPFLDVCTVHRPSIIVGDLVAGFTNTFHGFYKPLRIVQPFVEAFLEASLEPGSLLDVLGMTGDEVKNLVPVDWVSAVMTRIIGDPALHGRTYHITSTRPTPVRRLCRVFEELVVEMAAELAAARASGGAAKGGGGFDPAALARLFEDQMHVYRAYWSDDPRFDSSACIAAVPDLPAPELDDETIRRLCRFAIANRFRWPPPGRAARLVTARGLLEARLGAASWNAPTGGELVGLSASGGGGGQWTIRCAEGRPVELHVGLPVGQAPVISVAADVLGDLLAQGGDSATLRARGGLLIVGSDHASRGFAAKVLAGLADGGVGGGGRVTIAAPRFGAERAVAGIGAGW